MTLREKWAYFFKYAEETTEKDLEILIGKDLIIKRAYDELDRFSWTEKELNSYESIEMKQMADEAVKEASFDKGVEEGIEKGIEKGIKEGIKEGRKEEKLEIARALLKQRLAVKQISKATGLSEKELENLKEAK